MATDLGALKTFVNEVLAEPWENRAGLETVDAEKVADRSKKGKPRGGKFDPIPCGARGIFVGVDTHEARFYFEVVAFGLGEETWSVWYDTIEGDPAAESTRQDLDEKVLLASFRTEDGRELPVLAGGIDSGGHRTDDIYKFCRPRYSRCIWALKGAKEVDKPIVDRKTKRPTAKTSSLHLVGVNAAKDQFFASLSVEEPGPRFCHFPAGRDEAYFRGLVESEVRRPGGRWTKRHEGPTCRNEPLDCRIMALCAKRIWEFKGNRIDKLPGPPEGWEPSAGASTSPSPAAQPTSASVPGVDRSPPPRNPEPGRTDPGRLAGRPKDDWLSQRLRGRGALRR